MPGSVGAVNRSTATCDARVGPIIGVACRIRFFFSGGMKSEFALRGSFAISFAAMPDFRERVRLHEHQVVVGRVGVGEDQLHRLARRDRELIDGEQHPLGDARRSAQR